MNKYDVVVIGGAPPGCRGPGLARARRRSWWSTPASRATPPPPTCTATSPVTACPPPTAGRRPRRGRRVRRRDRRRHRHRPGARRRTGSASFSTTGSGSRPAGAGHHRPARRAAGHSRAAERWARDVLHCPYCHGHEVRDQRLGVIGGTPGSVRYAQIVRQWTHDLVYFTPPGILTAAERTQLLARAIGVVEGTIDQLVIDDDRLRGVQMATAASSRATPCSSRPASSRTTASSSASAATSTPTAGSPSTPPGAPASPGLGRRQHRRPARPGHHRRRRRLRRRHRDQRRPGRRRRTQRRPRPRPRLSTHSSPHTPTRRSHDDHPDPTRRRGGPPTKHQLALMIWLAVFPTLTVLNLALATGSAR